MRKVVLFLLSIICLSAIPAAAIEVRTQPKVLPSDRKHYPEYANRFQQALKSHPVVSDAAVLLHSLEGSEFVERIEITIKIDPHKLEEFFRLQSIHPKHRDRYLDNFKDTIRKSALSIFTDVKPTSIHVEVAVL